MSYKNSIAFFLSAVLGFTLLGSALPSYADVRIKVVDAKGEKIPYPTVWGYLQSGRKIKGVRAL